MGNFRGALYKKLKINKHEKYPKTRAGQMLYLMRQNSGERQKFCVTPTKSVFVVPTYGDINKSGMIYPLIKPYAYVHVNLDEKDNAIVYNVIEPKLTENESSMLNKIKDGLIQTINISLEDIKKENRVLEFLEGHINKLIKEYNLKLSDTEYLKIMYYVFRDFIGLNEIEPLLKDPYIEDIGLDGINIPLYVVHRKFGSIRTNIIYKDEEKLREFVIKLAERCDRYISYSEPLLDGSLPDGTRVQASLASDVTTRGPTFSLRRFREVPFSPVDVMRLGTVSAEMLAYLWFIIENGANMLIAGGVATGKTSFLNSLSVFIPQESKIVSIEDTRELSIPHDNWIPGVVRTGFTGSGVGEVSMFELLKESFRQNPDYLIVGEVRGKEAYVMFQGMASGHPTISTIHAGSVDDVIKRLQTKPINLSPGLMESLDLIVIMVHARERGKSARRVKEIAEIESIDSHTGSARISKPFIWLASEDVYEYRGDSWLISKISTQKGIPINKAYSEISKKKKIINWMLENNITEMNKVNEFINMYRNDKMKFEQITKIRDAHD